MSNAYIIRAAIDSTDATGLLAGDFFVCGVNDTSEHYSSADAALMAARAAYKGSPGTSCRVWAERKIGESEFEAEPEIAAA
jgi:hypothetical protein